MLKYINSFLLASIFLFFFAQTVSAQIVINEIFANPSGDSSEPTEFIELYNTSNNEVNLEGYTLSEAKSYEIAGVTIAAKGFRVFARSQTGLALNNAGDTVILKDASDTLLDTVTFNETVEDKSYSRVPDGTGSFVQGTTPSSGAANIAPAATATPTQAPTATPAPTSTAAPTATKSPTKIPTKTPTPSPKEEVKATSDESNVSLSDARDKLKEKEEDKSSDDVDQKSQFPLGAVFIVVGGLLLLGSAAFIFFRNRKQSYN